MEMKEILFQRNIPVAKQVDVFIAGGGPAGLSAAVTAARMGASVFLAEKYQSFGGAAALSSVPAFMRFSDGVNFMAGGVGREVFDALYGENVDFNQVEFSVDIEKLKRIYDDMMVRSGADFLFDCTLIGVQAENGSISSVVLQGHEQMFAVQAKTYIDCALLTEQDQNVLLKVVEEGPPYAAFLFCAENAAVVLQTLRSRCVELKLHPAAEGGGEEVQAAEALCRCLAARKRGKVTELAVRLEKKRITREDLSALLERSRALCAAALLLQYGQEPEESCREIAPILAKNLTKSQIMRTIELLQKYRGECTYNVGTGHVLGAIAVELEGIL